MKRLTQVKKRRRRYRLRSGARRFYLAVLVGLLTVLAVVLLLRITVFRTSFSVGDYDPAAPFSDATAIYGRVSDSAQSTLLVENIQFVCDSTMKASTLTATLYEPLSSKAAVPWKLVGTGERLNIQKGKKISGDALTAVPADAPNLYTVLGTLKKLPLREIANRLRLSDTETLSFTTAGYLPLLNPDFRPNVTPEMSLVWVSGAGAVSQIRADYNPVSDYMALECSVLGTDGTEKATMLILVEASPS